MPVTDLGSPLSTQTHSAINGSGVADGGAVSEDPLRWLEDLSALLVSNDPAVATAFTTSPNEIVSSTGDLGAYGDEQGWSGWGDASWSRHWT